MKSAGDTQDRGAIEVLAFVGSISRKPASLEAWLEVFHIGATEGSIWHPAWNAYFALFRVQFRVPFQTIFLQHLDFKMGSKIGLKSGPKSVYFLATD